MFHKLRTKWQVGVWQLFVILTCFAIAGSLTGYVGRRLMTIIGIDQLWLWWVIYIIMVSILWPIFVIMVGLALGQYRFFKNYLGKMADRMSGRSKNRRR